MKQIGPGVQRVGMRSIVYWDNVRLQGNLKKLWPQKLCQLLIHALSRWRSCPLRLRIQDVECHWHSEPLREVWEWFFLPNILCIFLCALCGKSGGQVGLCKGPWSKSAMKAKLFNALKSVWWLCLIGIPVPTLSWQSVMRRSEGFPVCYMNLYSTYLFFVCMCVNELINSIE